MIDTNLKNGFDKVEIIIGNLESDHNMKREDSSFENEHFKVDINYDGYDTKNTSDTCSIQVTNKTNDDIQSFDFKQTYHLNKLNNTSQITVEDLNDKEKTFTHDRDYEGNIKGDNFKELSKENQLVSFDKYIDNSLNKNGILGTQTELLNDSNKMGFSLKNEMDNETSEVKLILTKNDDIDEENPFKNNEELIEISVLKDSNNNHHGSFKMENNKGVIKKSITESNEEYINNSQNFINKSKEKKEELEI